MNRNELKAHIEKCERPKPTKSYVEYNAIFKKTVYSLNEAEKYAQRGQQTSNLDSSEEESENHIDNNDGGI